VVLFGVVAATWRARWRRDVSNRLVEALMLMLIVSWASLFLASELSYPLWLIDTPLRLIQFPHRFIYVSSATGLLANLLALSDPRRIGQTRLQKLVVALPLVLGLAATGVLSAKLSLIDGKPHRLSVDETKPYGGLPEYRLPTRGEHWQDYYRAGGLAAECAEKMLTCRAIETSSLSQAWLVSGAQPAHLRLPLFVFPAWQVTIDGTSAPSTTDPATGLISIDLPAGTHRVAASWTRLGAERIGLITSGLTALVLIVIGPGGGCWYPFGLTRSAPRAISASSRLATLSAASAVRLIDTARCEAAPGKAQ
jgi:hypothetical protein